MQEIRSRYSRKISVLLLFCMSFQLLYPLTTYGLTSGPTQPEVNSFSPIGANDMVDLFSGDFSYNIPLMEVGDYPLNLIYNSNPTSDQEASWVGLGWNINPGAINRSMRGLPDDFWGDTLVKEFNMKDNKTWGIDLGANVKLFGFHIPKGDATGDSATIGLNANIGISANNYKGYGINFGLSPSLTVSKPGGGEKSAALGMQVSSQDGTTLSATATYSSTANKNNNSFDNKASLAYNTRGGLQELSFSRTRKHSDKNAPNKNGNANTNVSISFGYPTFNPTIAMPMHNNSFTFNGTVGGELWGIHGNLSLTGYWSKQTLETKRRVCNSYGYLNSAEGSKSLSAVQDFNREKDGPYNKAIPNLPLANYTYDLFSINGQGISGQFRAHRGDIGILYDNITTSGSESTSGGIQLGFGPNLAHAGANIAQVAVNTTSKKWTDDNRVINTLDFQNHTSNLTYEGSYFKTVGEQTLSDTEFNNYIGNENPVVNILKQQNMVNLPFLLKTTVEKNRPIETLPINSVAARAIRDKRIQNISYLTGREITAAGLNLKLISFTKNVIPDYRSCISLRPGVSHTSWWTTIAPKPAHHISEITVNKPDGKRYVYGIPTYNNFQKDVTFACKDLGTDPASGLVEYIPNVDNNKDHNTRGLDNFYSSETTPGYAYSYLISGILSADYIDRTGDGISDDDNGDAIKFNYTLATADYKWRVPYEQNQANYNGGLHAGNGSPVSSVGGDAKGSYSYGQKEIWYVNSIESRTLVAVFKIEDRLDAMGVESENGGQPSASRKYACGQKLLRSIELYSKSDLIRNPYNAVPIKTVHFVYDYSLCPNVPNNTSDTINNTGGSYSYYTQESNVNQNKGKLTLKKVYFTYGSNTKGQLNSYSFNYSVQNPDYGLKNYDRWGNYKTNSSLSRPVSTAEFPYTIQDTLLTNPFIRSYNLESINLPSGGTIKVDLESDDYAYVQNKRAGEMYFVSGVGSDKTGTISFRANRLYNDANDQCNILFIDVPNTDNYYEKYIKDLENIYYRFYMDLGGGLPDYVPGYCAIDRTGNWHGIYQAGGPGVQGVIWVKIDRIGNKNPVARSAWQFLKNNYPEVIYPGSSDPGNNLGDAMTALIGSFKEIATMFDGFETTACKKHWAETFIPEKSFVRLTNSNYKKLGGGSRVKRITISDNWNSMSTDGLYKEYGQEYFYADTTGGKYISSGVANWEPVIGNDENPFKQPVNYEITKPLGSSDYGYLEEPFGESFFPSPVVGYSKVYVSNFSNEHIRRTATGYTENTFYTAKDFPVITARTNILSAQKKPPFKLSFLGSLYSSEKWMVSQGYSIEINDMHGKPKNVKIRNAFGHDVSSTEYVYKSENFKDHLRLNEHADIITPKGEIYNREIAQDIDLCMDMREENTSTVGEKLDYNSDGFIFPLGFFPLFIVLPPILPSFTSEEVQFRSVVATKVVHKYGILEKVIEVKDGSTVEKQNLLRDSETGEVLLTKTTNEFDEPIYNWTYPAHWAYKNMGPAYINSGLKIPNVLIHDGYIGSGVSNINDLLCDGDEIVLEKNEVPIGGRYYVGKYNGVLRVHDQYNFLSISSVFNFNMVDLKVVRSGRRNMQSLPIGSLTTIKSPPINSSTNTFEVASNARIISASALEYNDKWKIYCGEERVQNCDTVVPEFCLENFVNAMINYNLNHSNNVYNACVEDSITVGELFDYCHCSCDPDSINEQNVDSMPFYSLNCPSSSTVTSYSEWHFGECNLSMTSLSGNPINLDSLMPVLIPPSNPFDGVVYVGVNHRDSVLFDLRCISCQNDCENLTVFANPYHRGMINNWHPSKTWNYYTNRKPLAVNASRIKDDGYYEDFTPFWNYSSGWNNTGKSDPNWIATNTVTRISKQGTEIESHDALDHYSSAIYGYVNSFVKAVTANARLKQTANDNFEDYDFRNSCSVCISQHFDFQNSLDTANGISISTDFSHTGNRSLHIANGKSAFVEKDIMYKGEDSLYIEKDSIWYEMVNGCIDKFSPDSGKYILSVWVKEDAACGPVGYSQDSIVVSFTGNTAVNVFYPKGVVVEGWQRYDEVFDVPANATKIRIELCAGTNTAYFDDFRIYPYHSNMKSFVYSSRSLRLMSELDANNYATFYEYDDEGHLIRVKKETERGVMTIKEAQTNFKKQ